MKFDRVPAAKNALLALLLCCVFPLGAARSQGGPLGIFEGQGDVGGVLHPGSVSYDASRGVYTAAGSGDNMWFGRDESYFVWKNMPGDVSLAADIDFVGPGSNPHRKAVLVIRQNLGADPVYADVALHGVGLTSLQYRESRSWVASPQARRTNLSQTSVQC